MTSMERRGFVISALALAVGMHVDAALPSADTRRDDVHAVYAAILTPQCACFHNDKERWLIEDTAYRPVMPVIVGVDGTEEKWPIHAGEVLSVSPPPERRGEVVEAVEDIRRQLEKPVAIEADMKLARPYQLVTAEERRQYFVLDPPGMPRLPDPSDAARIASVPAAMREKFAGVTGIDALSPVGFNAAGTLALVADRHVGAGCQSEEWVVLERADGGWKVLKWNATSFHMCA